jgi:hypothetical protein
MEKASISLKASHSFKKASILLKMYLKSLYIFEKPSHELKNASVSLKCLQKESKSLKKL